MGRSDVQRRGQGHGRTWAPTLDLGRGGLRTRKLGGRVTDSVTVTVQSGVGEKIETPAERRGDR